MNGSSEKLFQPDGDGPDAKLEFEQGGAYGYLWVLERSGREWERIGSIDLHPAIPTDYRGVCEPDESILEWGHTHFHAAGDRTRVRHRLVLSETDDGVVIDHQTERKEVLGCGRRDEHDWRTIEEWRVRPDGVERRVTHPDGESV
ncbi:hypothetical protein [Halomontanus rarus]|uniref:hypothetical protein n=1 Tax=Halomontanus rarus TaxID=3034020 RepID=UPI00307B5FFC